MARKLRIQYPGALYHVVNRGNYRRALFESVGAAKSFLSSLEEAVGMFGWYLHAYTLMNNHFHLVLETPNPNLIEGMHWLESTFGTRFNRFHSERGHLFQGRYHAGVIEDYAVLAHVVDYVHLNPVRAGIVSLDQMDRFRWSSLGAFVRGPRFPGLRAMAWLPQHGCVDTAEGWRQYLSYLGELATNLAEQKRLGWDGFSYGWALGSKEWSTRLSSEHAHRALNPGLERHVIRQLNEGRWNQALSEMLQMQGHGRDQLVTGRKGQRWKVQLGLRLRREQGASCAWLAKALNLGTPSSARSLFCRAK